MPAPDILINAKARDFLTGEFRKIEKSLGRLEGRGKKNFKELNKAARAFNKTLGLGKKLLAGFFLGRAAGAVVRGIREQISAVVDLGDQYGQLSDQLGLSVELLSELRFAAGQSRIGFNEVEQGLQRAIRRFEQFRQTGGGEAAAAFQILGDDIARAVRRGESFENLLPLLADRFRSLATDQERVLAAMKLFDSEGVKFVRLLEQGSEGIEELRREARELGLTFSREDVSALQEVSAELGRLQGALEGIRNQAVLEIAPQLSRMIEDLANTVRDNRGLILDFIRSMSIHLIDLARVFAGAVRASLPLLQSIAIMDRSFSDSLKSLSQWIASFGAVGRPPSSIDGFKRTLGELDEHLLSMRRNLEKLTFGRGFDIFDLAKKPTDLLRDGVEILNEQFERLDRILKQHNIFRLARTDFEFEEFVREAHRAREEVVRTFGSGSPTSAALKPEFDFDEFARGNEEAVRRAQAAQRAKEIRQLKTAAGGIEKFLEDARLAAENFGAAVADAANQGASALSTGLTNEILAFASGAKSAKEAWRDFAKQLLADLARIAIQLTINKAIQGGVGFLAGGAAKGGVFPGHFAPAPGLASGGVVSRRGTFELAEAGQFEAVVPLPDNRRIPVKILNSERMAARGGDRPMVIEQVNFNMSFPNVRNSEDARRAADQIAAAHVRRLKESQSFNDLHDAA